MVRRNVLERERDRLWKAAKEAGRRRTAIARESGRESDAAKVAWTEEQQAWAKAEDANRKLAAARKEGAV